MPATLFRLTSEQLAGNGVVVLTEQWAARAVRDWQPRAEWGKSG
jgi:hypothetical protein